MFAAPKGAAAIAAHAATHPRPSRLRFLTCARARARGSLAADGTASLGRGVALPADAHGYHEYGDWASVMGAAAG